MGQPHVLGACLYIDRLGSALQQTPGPWAADPEGQYPRGKNIPGEAGSEFRETKETKETKKMAWAKRGQLDGPSHGCPSFLMPW